MAATRSLVHVRPKRSLLRTAWLTFFVASVPLFGLLYWYGIGPDTWREVLAVHAAVTIAGLIVVWRQTRVFVRVTDAALVGNGIFSKTISTPVARIRSVELVPVYAAHSPETSLQLVAVDEQGNCRFRMRGHYWHESDLMEVAESVGAPVARRGEAISTSEFFERYPGSAYWFENRPMVRVVAAVVAVLALVATIAWVVHVIELPSIMLG